MIPHLTGALAACLCAGSLWAVALRRAGAYWATRVVSHGGYAWEYGADLVTRRRGKSKDLEPGVWSIVGSLNSSGRWLRMVSKREQLRDEKGRVGYEVDASMRLEMLESGNLVQNVETLAAYLESLRGGPALYAGRAAGP